MVSPDDSETRAVAIVGMSFGVGLISVLESKKILTSQEVDSFLDGVLTSLEGFLEPNDPGIKKARVLVDAIGQVVALGRNKIPK